MTTHETKHTPGPWRAYRNANGTKWRVTSRLTGSPYSSGSDICAMDSSAFYNMDNAEANASLIAAAPDLLAALKAMLANVDSSTINMSSRSQRQWAELATAARAAIAKAEGGAK